MATAKKKKYVIIDIAHVVEMKDLAEYSSLSEGLERLRESGSAEVTDVDIVEAMSHDDALKISGRKIY